MVLAVLPSGVGYRCTPHIHTGTLCFSTEKASCFLISSIMSSAESPKLRASTSSAFRTPGPIVSRLIVIRQQSPSTESLSDGSKLPVVQKSVPFEVVLGTPPGNPPITLSEFGLDAKLFLATQDGEGSEVAAAKSKVNCRCSSRNHTDKCRLWNTKRAHRAPGTSCS